MKSTPFFSLVIILTFLSVSPLLLFAQVETPSKYTVSYIDGTVRVQKPESEGWVTAESSLALVPGDKIQIAKKSKAELATSAGWVIRLDQNSTLNLEVSADTIIAGKSRIRFGEGNFYVNIPSGDSSFNAVIGLKKGNALIIPIPDTMSIVFGLGVGADSTFELRNYRGLIGFSFTGIDSISDSLNRESFPDSMDQEEHRKYLIGDDTIFLTAYEKAIVTSSGKIVYRGRFTPDDIDEKSGWVEWNKSRDDRK